MNSLTLAAQAKINLTMDVFARREDGYHDVATVMQSVKLADTVRVEIRAENGVDPGIRVTSNAPKLPVDERNTAFKAAVLFLRRYDISDTGVNIELTKRVPSGAGLGGGSADAAAVIIALDRLLETRLPRETLMKIGAGVGSDVPFCLLGGTAIATGRGEVLRPLNDLPDSKIVIVKPAFSLSTPRMFALYDGVSAPNRPDTDGMLRALESGVLTDIASFAGNAFERALPDRESREIAKIKSRLLNHGALCASMTGTGSAVFGIFNSNKNATKAFKSLRLRCRDCFLTEPSRSTY